jgi:ferredoxin
VLEGVLDHSEARRYYREDEEAGFALICIARPLSNVRLLTHQTAAMRRHRDRHGLPAPRGT